MKNFFRGIGALLFTSFCCSQPTLAQDTAFTYQGRLNDANGPTAGAYDLRFAIFDDASSGLQLGNTLTNSATAVSNGLFTVMLDFGNQFPGTGRWLEIGVRTNGNGSFTTLSPRQPLTPTPYAIRAATAGSVAATNIAGSIASAQTVTGSQSNVIAATITNIVLNTANGLTNKISVAGNVATISIGSTNASNTANEITPTNFINFSPNASWPILSSLTVTGCVAYPQLNGTWTLTNSIYTKGSTNFLFYDSAYIGGWVFASRPSLSNSVTGVLEYDDSLAGKFFLNQFNLFYWTANGGLTYDTTAIFAAEFQNTTNLKVMPNGELSLQQGNYAPDWTFLSASNMSLGQRLITIGGGGFHSGQTGNIVFYGIPYGEYVTNKQIGQSGFEAGKINYAATYNIKTDQRIGVDLAVYFNSDASGGSMIERMVQMPTYYGTPNNQTSANGGWSRAMINHWKGTWLGDLPVSEHTYNMPPPARVTIVASTNDIPVLLLQSRGAYGGTVTNGGFWADGTNIFAMQKTVSFPIPQINTTNAILSAASSFTWKFSYAFSDTNYSVTVSGMGDTLASPQIGTKTTTNVVITFSPFTGTLNAIAARQ